MGSVGIRPDVASLTSLDGRYTDTWAGMTMEKKVRVIFLIVLLTTVPVVIGIPFYTH